MKRLIYILFFTSLPVFLQAQPVLNQALQYTIGESHLYKFAASGNVQPGPSGADVVWDYSGLFTYPDSVYLRIQHPDSTDYSGDFPDANTAVNNGDGSIGFTEITSGMSRLHGIVDDSLGVEISYDRPYDIIERPFSYLDSLTIKPERSYTFSGMNIRGAVKTHTHADAWGELRLPGELVYENVVRVRFEHSYTDTILIPFPAFIESYHLTYAWFEADRPDALFSIDSMNITSDMIDNISRKVVMYRWDSPVNLSSDAGDVPVRLTGFLTDHGLHISYPFRGNEEVVVHVMDISGRETARYYQTAENTAGGLVVAMDPPQGIRFYGITIRDHSGSRTEVLKLYRD